MSEVGKQRCIARSEQLNLNLEGLFHNLIMLDFTYPICGAPSQQGDEGPDCEFGLIRSLGNVETLISTLKFLKFKEKKVRPVPLEEQGESGVSSLLFCRPVKHDLKDEKVFWIMQNKHKKKLNLDNPKAVLVLPSHFLIAIERKYINLYQVEENLAVSLKDFDSNGLGKKFTYTEMKQVDYRGKSFVLIFGNEKYHFQAIFVTLVFEITKGRLKFVKKAELADREIVSPTVIFEADPSSRDQEKFCLVLGGCCDNFETFHYSALKVNLHLLLGEFLAYDMSNTSTIPFSSRRSALMSGKAINFKEAWYCFCSEEQTISEVVLQYGGPGKALTMIEIRSERLNLKDKVLFSEDSMHYIYEGEEDKIVFLDKNLDLKQKSLHDFIYKLRS